MHCWPKLQKTTRLNLAAHCEPHGIGEGLHYRALGLPTNSGVHWFWIGTHAEYDRLVDA